MIEAWRTSFGPGARGRARRTSGSSSRTASFRRAQTVWGLPVDPVTGIEKYRQRSSGDVDVFSPEEASALVRAAGDEQDAAHLPHRGVHRAASRRAHASACAWVSAWLHLRGREWVSEREILDDDFWRFDLRYQDHRGTARRTHRPDLGVHTLSGPVAIEVELQTKTSARLRGICLMYAQLSEDDDAPLNGVIYVTARHDVGRLVTRNAASIGLDALRQLTLDEVIRQTRTAAGWVAGRHRKP